MEYCAYPNCSCSNVNQTEYTVSLLCNSGEYCDEMTSRCGVNVTDCAKLTREKNITEPYVYSIRNCFEGTKNGSFGDIDNCYYATVMNYSAVEWASYVNGDRCASCDVIPTFYDELYCGDNTTCYNITVSCYHFDCTNLEGGWKGNDCDDYPLFVQEYGCFDCDLCGPEEVVTIPDATFDSSSGVNVVAFSACCVGASHIHAVPRFVGVACNAIFLQHVVRSVFHNTE